MSQHPQSQPYASRFNTGASLRAFIDGYLARLGYNTPVRVDKVHDKDGNEDLKDNAIGFVDVEPLIQQQNATGNTIKQAIIFNVPYVRLQGGENAVIIDPQKGDLGYILITGRDQSHVLSNKASSKPASYRMHSFSDAVYVGGILNAAPKNYIRFDKDGNISVHTQGKLSVQAAQADVTVKDKDGNKGRCSISASEIEADCDIKTQGDVKAGTVSLREHVHGKGHNGADTTPPIE